MTILATFSGGDFNSAYYWILRKAQQCDTESGLLVDVLAVIRA